MPELKSPFLDDGSILSAGEEDRTLPSSSVLETPFLQDLAFATGPASAPTDEAESDKHEDGYWSAEEYETEAELDDDLTFEQEFELNEGCEEERDSDDECPAAARESVRMLQPGTERELIELNLDTGTLAEQQVGAPAAVNAYGSYNLRTGNAAARFWPLVPGTTVAAAMMAPPAGAPPGAPPPRIGIFDVAIVPTDDRRLLAAVAAPNLLAQVTAQPTVQSMPLVPDASGASRICFAVAVPANATHFDGTLRMEITHGAAAPGSIINVDLPIRVAAGTRAANLVLFFVVHPGINRRYAWMKIRAVENAQPQPAIVGADVQLNFLRDNVTFRHINRRITLRTDASGFAALGDRDVVGVPINWPLIFKATAPRFAPRGHMVRLAARDITDNLAPFIAVPRLQTLEMLASNVNLQGRRFMLDAGHGVVYALARHRRSQEWYVAHRVVDRIAELLQQRHNVNAGDIFQTRTAGFGLIEPGQIRSARAPEDGANRFAFDLANRRARIRNNAVGLMELSDLFLTQHAGAAHAAQPIAAADRTRLLTINAATVAAIEARLNQQLGPGRRVRPNSMRWDPVAARYIFTREPAAGGAGVDRALQIRTTDWWSLDAAMMENLIDRSARWSLLNEIGSVAAAQQIPGHAFQAAARGAMLRTGALNYMRNKVRSYLPPAPNHAWAVGGTMGWGLARRVQFFNATNCDLYVSVHANAGGGKGGMSLVSNATQGVNVPPRDQIRIGKIALKYLDPFDQGLRQGGIAREIAGNQTPPLQATNQARDRYLYLEIEFMDARNPHNPNQYCYEQMVEQAFIDRVAEQTVAAALEILLARQAGLDAVQLNNVFPLW